MRLPYISPIPRLYLAYISPLSRSGDDASRRASLEGLRVGRALLDAISSGDPNPNPNPSPSPNPNPNPNPSPNPSPNLNPNPNPNPSPNPNPNQVARCAVPARRRREPPHSAP